MDINLRDYFKIDDSHSKIRGFLIAKDEDGNILVKKENMIVKSGRALIFNAITGGNELDLKDVKAKISEDYKLTTSDMIASDMNTDDLCADSKNNYSWPVSVNLNSTDLILECTFSVEGFNKNYNANSLGLFYGEGDNETLFSRVVFNTIGLSTNRKVTFHYYIYF